MLNKAAFEFFIKQDTYDVNQAIKMALEQN